ncbi:hypothetical protein HNQ02_002543 [Flavobacterium sp. 7E]|uniref:hypothetical protein n=1 Tax=unclassified Flavobacterium TaxID=196869 RepID=UPI0015710587|nr:MULTISPECIES: hypothetical protein [unclassified Flavobacterium]MBE0391990.1 hypothetical protein [Flavobacterium sp. PL002]NRS89612.1 hypothetical protein [Flavobacterium sp. 7E]
MALFVMGFLRTIPSDEIKATYDVMNQVLILSAKGCVMGSTYGYAFKRDFDADGLQYKLQAWSGFITGQMHDYDFDEKFIMPLPLSQLRSAHVSIITANYPEGFEVVIEYENFQLEKLNEFKMTCL